MVRSVPSRWQGAILVCGKCTKRAGGGFGDKGRSSLAKALREADVGGRARKAGQGIVETPCLKLCPKNAVVAIDTRSPQVWLLVRPRSPTDEIVPRLGPAIAATEEPR